MIDTQISFEPEIDITEPAFSIRRATREDADKIKALLRMSSIHTGNSRKKPESQRKNSGLLRRGLSVLLRPLYSSRIDWMNFVVAVTDGGSIIGCGKVKPHKNNAWEVTAIAVDRTWRGTGLAISGGKFIVEQFPRPLWGICPRRYIPFYQKFGAVEVVDSKRVPVFLRIRQCGFNTLLRLTRRKERLAVLLIAN